MKTQRRLPAGSGPHPAPSPCPQELRGRTQPRLATGHSWHRSSQLSCRSLPLPASFPPSPLRFRPRLARAPPALGKPRLGGASLLPRAPLCSSPRRLLSPSGCASQRLRHSWDAAREVFVIDPSSPRPGFREVSSRKPPCGLGARRSVAFSGCCLFALPSQSAAFRCPADPRRPPRPSVPPPGDSPHSGASLRPSRRVHTPPPLHSATCSPA